VTARSNTQKPKSEKTQSVVKRETIIEMSEQEKKDVKSQNQTQKDSHMARVEV